VQIGFLAGIPTTTEFLQKVRPRLSIDLFASVVAVETMLSRAFSQVLGKGSKRPLDLLVHASSAAVRFGSNMPRHLHHPLPQPEPAASGTVGMSFEQRFATLKSIGFPLQNGRGAPPTCTTLESNWTNKQHSFSTVKNNSDDTPLDSASGTVGMMSFEERLATLRSIGDCADDQYELSLLLKRKTAPVCYVWCDPTPWMHISQGILMTANVNKMIKAGCKVKIFGRLGTSAGP
jgi:tyrosyl-tRNA synthetase